MQKELAPTVTKDGVTVARSIDLADPLEQMGANLILQASKQADDKSGDGTTTTIVLGRHATVAAMKMRESGMLTVHVRERLKEMREWLEAELIRITAGFKVTADTVRQVALVSGNGDTTIADIAMKAYEAARGGRIDVYKSRGEDDILTIREGCVVSGRALTVDALARGRAATFFGKPAVAIVNGYVESTTLDIINAQSPECAVIVFAHHLRDGLEEKVTSINQRRDRNSPIVIAPCPGVGTVRQVYIDAMVAMFGCPVYEHGYETMEFGSVDAVEFDDDYVIINPNKDIFDEEAVATTIRNMRNNFPIGTTRYVQHDEILRFVLGRRVFITVGGCTESEIGERHDRMVDAVRAMGLVEQGIIPGGGTVLAKMSTRLPEHLRMFEPVLIAPMAKILENGGVENSEEL
ncbi:MAG: TCP-1/cpn60 chaperonin family protein, partial [Plesiomonas shigelloides]